MRPNICVLVLDAARAANFSCYGHRRETSPNLDTLAPDSVVFDTAVSPAPVTFDSVTSFLAGLYPEEHRSGEVRQVNTSVPLLPEYLRDRGYRTGAVSSSPSTTPAFGFGRGFDRFDDVTHPYAGGLNVRKFFEETKHLPRWRRYARFARRVLDRHLPAHLANAYRFKFGRRGAADDGGRAVADATIDFIEAGESPWFVYAHFTETHMNRAEELPYRVPREDAFWFVEGAPDPTRLTTRSTAVDYDPETADLHERLYDGAIRYLDGLVGDVVVALRRTDQFDDTLLVVTADHGECIADHGLLGHGFAYEPALRVPFVAHHPEFEPRRVGDRVNSLWFYRTVADLLDDPVGHPRGVDLFSGEYPESVLVQDFSQQWSWSTYQTGRPGVSILYRGALKYVDRGDERELYDLEADPGEAENLASRQDLNPFSAALDELRADFREPDLGEIGEISAAAESRLRDLGYI